MTRNLVYYSLPSVADPGFFPGGRANSQNCYYFSNFCRKLHENEKIWTGGGLVARVPGAPLGSANGHNHELLIYQEISYQFKVKFETAIQCILDYFE